jgi:paraquat-inducible protein A
MKVFPSLIVCEHCDAVYVRPLLAPRESARCDECAATLCRSSRPDLDRWLALTVAAAIVYAIANLCPVMRISFSGLHNEATLWQSALALAHGPAALIAVPAVLSMIVVPLAQIVLLGWVLLFAYRGQRAPGFPTAMKLLVLLRPWSMVEVALIGILVSVIKLAGFVRVIPGAGLWAMAALAVLITLIASPDVRRLWDLTDIKVHS